MENLIRAHIIKCLRCYDLGQIIDRFDHGRRRPCGCGAGKLTKKDWLDTLTPDDCGLRRKDSERR